MPSSHVEGQQPVSSGSQSSISRALADMLSPILSKRRDSGSKQPPVSPSTPCNPPKSSSQRVAAGTSPRLHPGKPSSILADLEDSYNRAPPSLTARAAFACPASPTTPAYHPVLNVSPSPSAISTDSGYISSMDSPRVSPGGAMTVFPALHRLLAAARICALPLPRTEPAAGTPNYPTTMLSLSSTVPAAMQRPNWCLADYAITDKLYEGYASNVLKGFCRQSGHLVVLKVYKLSAVCDLYKYQIFREVRLHSSLQHENVVTMFAAFQEGDSVVMIEEYADGADLFTVLQRYGGRLSERVAVQMVLDPFIRVLDYLHSRGIIHRDIKPENILFDKNMKLKLADFGLAIDLGEERAVTRAGTLDYMAPEVLKCPYKSRPNDNKDDSRLHYDGGVDSWAVGILAFELVVGCPPFYDKMRKHTEERILNMAVTVPQGVSAEARHFILSALSKDPANRLSVADMVSHPWIETLRNSSSTPRQQQQQQLRRSLQMHAMASSVGQPMDMSPQPSPRQPQLQPAPTALRSASTIRPNIAAAAKAALAAPATPRAAVAADKTQQPAQPAKPAAAEASTRSAAPSPRALAAAPSPSASPRDALSKLLDGKGSLEEYLQEQKRRQADKQKQQAAAKAAAIQALAAGASPGERLLAALGQRTARADGSVIMNVRHATAKLGVSGSKVTPPSGRPSILAQHAEAAAK